MKRELFDLRLDQVCKRFEIEYSAWLRRALRFANKKSLKDKLTELIALTQPVSGHYLRTRKATRSFCACVSDVRNKISHGLPYSSPNLANVTRRLTRLVEILLLLNAGFPLNEIDTAVQRLAWRDIWDDDTPGR